MKKYPAILVVLFLAAAASAAGVNLSATSPKVGFFNPIYRPLNSLAEAAEQTFRRTGAGDNQDAVDQKELDATANQLIGQRVNVSFIVRQITPHDGKIVASGKLGVNSKALWDDKSQQLVDARKRDWDQEAATKLKTPVLKSEIERHQARVAAARQAYYTAREYANARALARIPDAAIEVEFDELPAYVRVGAKPTLTGWVSGVSANPKVIDGIAYADIKVRIIFDRPPLPGSSTRPAMRPATTNPAGTVTSPAAEAATAPATQASE